MTLPLRRQQEWSSLPDCHKSELLRLYCMISGNIEYGGGLQQHVPTSAPTTSRPTRPSSIVSSSRVLQPPTSAVPVAVLLVSRALSEQEVKRFTRRKGWIEHIDVHRDVHFRSGNSFLELLNDTLCSDAIDVPSSHHLESTTEIIAHVAFLAYHRSTNASMNGAIRD